MADLTINVNVGGGGDVTAGTAALEGPAPMEAAGSIGDTSAAPAPDSQEGGQLGELAGAEPGPPPEADLGEIVAGGVAPAPDEAEAQGSADGVTGAGVLGGPPQLSPDELDELAAEPSA